MFRSIQIPKTITFVSLKLLDNWLTLPDAETLFQRWPDNTKPTASDASHPHWADVRYFRDTGSSLSQFMLAIWEVMMGRVFFHIIY
jgi:hypothetical protein